MRYDGLIESLEKARAIYETKVQEILQHYVRRNAVTADKMLASLPGKKKLHWTQMPKNKARLRKQLQHAARVKANGKA